VTVCHASQCSPGTPPSHGVCVTCELIKTFGIGYHQFTNDKQLHVYQNSANAASSMDQLTTLMARLFHRFMLNGLQKNVDNSKAKIPCTTLQLQSAGESLRQRDVAGTLLSMVNKSWTFGFMLDSHLHSDTYASALAKVCGNHL
jgi:hypothetical protein